MQCVFAIAQMTELLSEVIDKALARRLDATENSRGQIH